MGLTIGCRKSGLQLGESIPSDIEAIKLSEILAKPRDYHGKAVVFKGIITGQCASLCEFFMRDGTEKATIFPYGYKFPKLERNKPVTVYAQVTSGDANVVFSALGVQVEKGK